MHLESAAPVAFKPAIVVPPRAGALERRVSGQLEHLWQQRRNGRAFPLRDAVALPTLGAIGEQAFILALATPYEDSFVIDCGDQVRAALSRDPVGQRWIDVVPRRLRRRLTDAVRYAGQLGVTVDDAGSWRRAEGPVVLYRIMLLPLSDDQNQVDHLLGVLSYRLVHTV
jgi:hypothetical protein